MKVAIYIEDGEMQVVLTPQNDWEKAVAEKMAPRRWNGGTYEVTPVSATLHRGQFYECRGGWYRHGSEDDSLMLRLKSETKPFTDIPFVAER